MPNSFIITPLLKHPGFIPEVIGLIQKTWPGKDEATVTERLLGKRIEGQLPIALIATEQGKLLGFTSLILFTLPERKELPHWVDTLYVSPQYRGQRIASKLLGAVKDLAQDLKLPVIAVYTSQVSLYKRHGWIPEKTPTATEPTVIMIQKLVPRSL